LGDPCFALPTESRNGLSLLHCFRATIQSLGSAQQFGVLGATTVTNTGASTIKGNLGVSPGTAITGLGTATVVGTIHLGDAAALQAQTDATTAYNSFAALPFTSSLTRQILGSVSSLAHPLAPRRVFLLVLGAVE